MTRRCANSRRARPGCGSWTRPRPSLPITATRRAPSRRSRRRPAGPSTPSSRPLAARAAAGVAVDTVYAAFGSKRGVLQALLGVRVGGDEDRIDLLDRPGPKAVEREQDQKAQVAAFATDVSAILERARPVDDIIRGAAAVDADIAAFRSEAQAYRYRNMRKLASWIAAKG